MHKYRLISKKGEGTFSEVLKAQSIKTGRHVAIKCMKNTFDSIDQVNNLREIQALRRLGGHPNVIKLTEVLYDEPTGRLALVFELMDMNMYEAIRGRRHYLPEAKVQHVVYELIRALDHMHRHGIFHRDVKPENLLLSSELTDVVKLADLGSCRGIYSRQPYTEYISTRWYRAPECLLTDGYYNFKMDIFAAGCVWFEIMALFPLFPGANELDQIQKIHNVLGTPSPDLLTRKFKRNASHMDFNFPEKRGTGIERLIPHASAEVTDLMKKLLEYDPDDRIVARQALKDPYFRELRDAERQRGKNEYEQEGSSRQTADVRPPNPTNDNQSSSSSVGAVDPEATAEVQAEESEHATSGTLPALGNSAHRLKEMSLTTVDVHPDDEELVVEDSTTLPPIGKAGIVRRSGKKEEKAKAFKAVANATLRGSSGNFSHTTETASSSKGFQRQPQATDPLGNSYGRKFGQISATNFGQSSNMGQSSSFGQSSTMQNSHASQSTGSFAAPSAGRSEPKGQMPRQYVSPYSHKQVKR